MTDGSGDAISFNHAPDSQDLILRDCTVVASSAGHIAAASSLIADPQLGTLAIDNGMLVLPPRDHSPAIGLAQPAQAPVLDARGRTRDADPDSGAVESPLAPGIGRL